MSFLLAISPGLIWFGPLLLVLGGLGLALSPVGRSEIRRVLVTGFVVTLVGTMPQLLVGPMAGAAHANTSQAPVSPAQTLLLSGMTSQIVYDAD